MFQALRKAKAELSSQATATIDIPELDLEIEISRHSFESMLTPLLAEIDGLINETLHEAGVDEEAVSLVIRTGGSSLIACIRDRLNHIFRARWSSMTRLRA